MIFKEEATLGVSSGSESKFTSPTQGRAEVDELSRQRGRCMKRSRATEEVSWHKT